MLGNDIVDLQDSDSRPESFRARFDLRVFSAEERRAIARDPDPLARRWAHWAAKRAAFKLVQRIQPESVFAPGRCVVDFDPTDAGHGREMVRPGVVRWIDTTRDPVASIEVRSFESVDHVHSVAIPSGADWGAVDSAVECVGTGVRDPHAEARRLAIAEAARSLGIDPPRLAIVRSPSTNSGWKGGAPRDGLSSFGRNDVPSVELDGVRTSLSLSIAHHGRFISFAMAPRFESVIQSNRPSEPVLAFAGSGAMRP